MRLTIFYLHFVFLYHYRGVITDLNRAFFLEHPVDEACRPVAQRLDQHKRSLKARDKKRALSEHALSNHRD